MKIFEISLKISQLCSYRRTYQTIAWLLSEYYYHTIKSDKRQLYNLLLHRITGGLLMDVIRLYDRNSYAGMDFGP